MGLSWVAVGVMTALWAVVGIVFPFIFGKGPNKGVIQTVLVISALSCWLFWLLCYLQQMNPLIGPQLSRDHFIAVKYLWDGNTTFFLNSTEAVAHWGSDSLMCWFRLWCGDSLVRWFTDSQLCWLTGTLVHKLCRLERLRYAATWMLLVTFFWCRFVLVDSVKLRVLQHCAGL